MSIVRPILLVEDNPMDVDLTLRAFRRRNVNNPVHVARDGEEAIGWVPRWVAGEIQPAVVLLDLNLPRISGLDVLRAFRAEPASRTLPVVVLSTSRENTDIQTAYQLGANSYIVKPVDFEKFIDVAAQIDLYWCLLNERPAA